MFRKTVLMVITIAVAAVFMGMGGTGGFERAPRVDKNFAVVVTDASGTTISGEKFSWEGRVHLAGSIGMAEVTLPFENIRQFTVGARKERKVSVTVKLMDGTETVLDVDAKARCFGEAAFGSFMLQMDEIKTVTFKKS